MSSTQQCEVCGTRVTTLRRGRCPVCYLRWAEGRAVGLGATCVVCGERRRAYLRLVEYQRAWLPMCHNCASRVVSLEEPPKSVDGLRQVLMRDRRRDDRRDEPALAFPLDGRERRVGERRAPPLADLSDDWIDAEELIIEIVEDAPGAEQTRIADGMIRVGREAGTGADPRAH